MERIEVCKSADGADLARIETPPGPLFVPRESLERLRPSEIVEIAKSAERSTTPDAELYEPIEYDDSLNDSDPYASEREQFEQGSREMFGEHEQTEPKEPDPRGRNVLGPIFENTQTVFAAELPE